MDQTIERGRRGQTGVPLLKLQGFEDLSLRRAELRPIAPTRLSEVTA